MMRSFQYAKPTDVQSLLATLKNLEASGRKFLLSSGGTDLMPQLKQECLQPEVLISLSGIQEFSQISQVRSENNITRLKIGSRVTLSEFYSNTLVQTYLPCAAAAARKIASPQIQNRATVGGNLLVNNRCTYYNQSELNRQVHSLCYKAGGNVCHMVPNAKPGKLPLCRARFVSDLAPIFLLSNAEVHLLSSTGTRKMSLKDFYIADGIDRNHLKAGEVISHVEIDSNTQQKISYEKLRIRDAIDFPSLGVALSVTALGANSQIGGSSNPWFVQASVTGINTYPIWKSAEGSDLLALVEQVSKECTKEAVPMRQDFFPPTYRRKMISVLINKMANKMKELIS